MDWAALWSRGDRPATKPVLVLNYLEFIVEAPGVEPSPAFCLTINGHADLRDKTRDWDGNRLPVKRLNMR